jgi:hypothetical protein
LIGLVQLVRALMVSQNGRFASPNCLWSLFH